MAPLLYPSPVFWLTIVLCAATGLAYRLAWVAGSRYVRPSDMDILIEEEALDVTPAACRNANTRASIAAP